MNYLYLGDCLNVLRENVETESVDLIYIDPPFNSKRDYNMFFDDKEIQTQRVAFEDTWTLKNIQDSLSELHTLQTDNLYKLLETYREVAPHAFPYLVMMGLRIVELRRVLKSTGSFYLHCDPNMSHYLKTVCDVVFGAKRFYGENIWQKIRTTKAQSIGFGSVHDVIFMYAKGEKPFFKTQYGEFDPAYLKSHYKPEPETGRQVRLVSLVQKGTGPARQFNDKILNPPPGMHWIWSQERINEALANDRIRFTSKGTPCKVQYLDEMTGDVIADIWTDIPPINSQAAESLGYPTQKPRALLERIIQASSNEGDLVLDAFCGCGTTVEAAEGLHRKWIGIDVSPVAIALIQKRLYNTFKKGVSAFEVRGIPTDESSAIRLWKENPFAFQDWWVSEFGAFSPTQGTRGADKGVDGIAMYLVGTKGETIRAAFQVKGGGVQSKDIDALLGTMDKLKCELGIFLTIEPPTKPMMQTAAGSGFWKGSGFEYPKVQILTLDDFFANKLPKLPSQNVTFASAKFKGKGVKQEGLGL